MLIRSIFFTQLFILLTLLILIFWLPVSFIMPRKQGWKIVRLWGLISLHMQNKIIGTRFDFRGIENIPQEGGVLVSAKHQSSWETYVITLFLKDPSYILKKELMYLPLFGWFGYKMKVIAVKRGKKGRALISMTEQAKVQYADERQIIIYSEGTRRMAYAPPAYKYGITHMYDKLNARVLPVALNSGLFWPRRGSRVYPGLCVIEFLPVIEPGLEREVFTKTMVDAIENKCNELLEEGEKDPDYIAAKKKSVSTS